MGFKLGALALGMSAAALAAMGAEGTAQSTACTGCTGNGFTPGGTTAPAPCLDGAEFVSDWEVALSVTTGDGACTFKAGVDGEPDTCEAKPCNTAMQFSWGPEMAEGLESIGFFRPTGVPRYVTELVFPDGDPWEPGEYGTIAFDEDNSPELGCGSSLVFYIAGDSCGPYMATAEAGCGPCFNSISQGE